MKKCLPFLILLSAIVVAAILLLNNQSEPLDFAPVQEPSAADQLFFQSSLIDQEACLKARLGENRYQELLNNPDSRQLSSEEQATFRSCFE